MKNQKSNLPRWKILRDKLKRILHGKRSTKIIVSKFDRIVRSMTNWQNSQWMRAGGPNEHRVDEQLEMAEKSSKLEKK